MENTWAAGFRTQREECANVALEIDGSLPEWLEGTFVRNGPGQFEIGDTDLHHWFDPLAMVRAFRFADGEVRYTNRYVRSADFETARQEGRVRRQLPGTPADGSALGRLYRSVAGDFQDNPAIGLTEIDGALYAVTESPVGIELNPETLETVGRRDLTGGLDCDFTLGHTHVDDGTQWGLGLSFDRQSAITVFRRPEGETPEALTRLVFDHHPPYVHGFGLTEQYVVVPEASVGVDLGRLLAGTATGTTFIDAMTARDATPRFHVIDRETGERAVAVAADPFFIYHIANAYETGDAIVLDAVTYPDGRAVTGLTLDALRSDDPDIPAGDFVRYRLPLDGEPASREDVYPGPVEFPTINYGRVNGESYRYAYLAEIDHGSLPTALVKVDLEDGTTERWADSGLHPSEAIFVPAPGATAEDEGVLLSVALDGAAKRSELLCLDAGTMAELARAPLPHRLSYGFHGQFYGPAADGRSMH